MQGGGITATVEFYGVSPWEIEVAHECLGGVFEVAETELGEPQGGHTSHLRLALPVAFSDEFFEWFGFKRWERLKALLKEMKRRRGGGAGSLGVCVDFGGEPRVSFVVDSAERAIFVNALEKIDYVLETMPHHLEGHPAGQPLVYRFGARLRRWAPDRGDQDARGAKGASGNPSGVDGAR